MNESMHRKTKKALNSKQRHPMTKEHSKRRDLYFKPGIDACMTCNLKTLHQIFFDLLQENPQ
jgi:hypothetical protein